MLTETFPCAGPRYGKETYSTTTSEALFPVLHESGKQKATTAASQWNHPPLYLCDLKQMLAVH